MSDFSGIKRKFFGQMTVKDKSAYFDVDNTKDTGIGDHFKDVEIEGRSIRVNRDDEGTPRTQSRSNRNFRGRHSKKYGKNFNRSKGRR